MNLGPWAADRPHVMEQVLLCITGVWTEVFARKPVKALQLYCTAREIKLAQSF